MLFLIVSLCLISCFHISYQSPDIIASLTDITQAVIAGRQLSTELTSYLNNEESRLSKLREIILRLDTALEVYNTSDSNSHPIPSIEDKAANNPVSAFLTIIQLASNWSSDLSLILGVPNAGAEDLDSAGQKDVSMGVYKEFDSRRKMFLRLKWYADMLPDDNDVQGALDAVIRLQQTYNISSIEIADGRILPSSSSPRLSDWQCMRLGLFCYDLGDYARAIDWYTVVLDRLNKKRREGKLEGGKGAVSFATLYDHLSYALGRSGRYKEALETTKKLLLEDPTSTNGAMSKAFYEMELMRLDEKDPPHVDDESGRAEDRETFVFDYLCRKADMWIPPTSNLSCRYSTPHPYFLLNPLKEEIMQDDPPIILWHDFVTQNEVDEIIDLAKPKLKRALVRNPASGILEPATYRVTKNVWLPDDLNALTKRINKRISMATGLSNDHGEELQVANYGLGGYYAPHYDYARRFEMDAYEEYHGNRIATTMVYLTPVEFGGGTAFTKTGSVVKPVARSMVFWYNLLRSGDGDLRSRHGACPVLKGNKWVMNKWIRAAGQEFSRPCGLIPEPFNPDDEYLDP